jgi:hypothetical protein
MSLSGTLTLDTLTTLDIPPQHNVLVVFRPTEGCIGIVTDAGQDAVDAAALVEQRDRGV